MCIRDRWRRCDSGGGVRAAAPVADLLLAHVSRLQGRVDDLQSAKERIDGLGVRLLAISRDGTTDEVESYFSDNGYQFDVAVDAERLIYNLYTTMYVPRTYLINRSVVVHYTTIEYSENHIPSLIEMMATMAE